MAKKTLFIGLLLFSLSLPLVTFAEDNQPKTPNTKLEAFMSKTGDLYIREFYQTGQFNDKYGASISFDAIVVYTPGKEKDRIRGLKVDLSGGSREATSFLDLDELDGLSKGLAYLINLAKQWEPVNKSYVEVIFSTKDNFQIGFYQKGTTQTPFVSSGYISKSYYFCKSMDDLSLFKTQIDKGIELLNSK